MTEEKNPTGKGVTQSIVLAEFEGYAIIMDKICYTTGKLQKAHPTKGLKEPSYTPNLKTALAYLKEKTFKEKAMSDKYNEGQKTLNNLYDLVVEHNKCFKEAMSKAFE